ncbi:MAG TPA: hypothetical protein ENI22_00680 [Candidatus Pacearchaeota archaeon]|nr:hypothetical protein [Candidatus Pacearchaeota archaeon]
MKFKELFISFTLAGLVIFSLFSFFFGVGSNYDFTEENLTVRNVSIEKYKERLEKVEEDSEKLQNIFKSENIIVTAFNLIIKGIPSAIKIIYFSTVANMNLIFSSGKAIFVIPSIIVSVAAGIIIIILIMTAWDNIRGIKPS